MYPLQCLQRATSASSVCTLQRASTSANGRSTAPHGTALASFTSTFAGKASQVNWIAGLDMVANYGKQRSATVPAFRSWRRLVHENHAMAATPGGQPVDIPVDTTPPVEELSPTLHNFVFWMVAIFMFVWMLKSFVKIRSCFDLKLAFEKRNVRNNPLWCFLYIRMFVLMLRYPGRW